jgi:hypothetical protein
MSPIKTITRARGHPEIVSIIETAWEKSLAKM